MYYLKSISLQDCFSDMLQAKNSIKKLVFLPLEKYFEGCEEELKIINCMDKKINLPLETLGDLYCAYCIYDIDHEGNATNCNCYSMLYKPFEKSDYFLKDFAFSLGAFINVMDELINNEDSMQSRQKARKNLEMMGLIDKSINQTVKWLFTESPPELRDTAIDIFSAVFMGGLWEYKENLSWNRDM